jgi:hypothetical protein
MARTDRDPAKTIDPKVQVLRPRRAAGGGEDWTEF